MYHLHKDYKQFHYDDHKIMEIRKSVPNFVLKVDKKNHGIKKKL